MDTSRPSDFASEAASPSSLQDNDLNASGGLDSQKSGKSASLPGVYLPRPKAHSQSICVCFNWLLRTTQAAADGFFDVTLSKLGTQVTPPLSSFCSTAQLAEVLMGTQVCFQFQASTRKTLCCSKPDGDPVWRVMFT